MFVGVCHFHPSRIFTGGPLGATTLSIMTFSIMTFSIMTFSIMTFSIMTFSIKGINVKLSIRYTEQKKHSALQGSECHYAECH